MATEFDPSIFSLGDRAGQGRWEVGHYRQHLHYLTKLAGLSPAIIIADHPILRMGVSDVQRKLWLADHANVHNILRQYTNVSGIDLSAVDINDPNEFQVWLDSHATEHQLIDQALGL
jgi:hypothetical protein